ncbi:hypothetical protein FQZ97_1248340 [compost metagenome]
MGAKLARDEAGTSTLFIACKAAFASRLAPTLDLLHDLGRPVNHDGRTQALWSGPTEQCRSEGIVVNGAPSGGA